MKHVGRILRIYVKFNPSMDTFYTRYTVWDEIMHPFPYINVSIVEVSEWI